jgi:hypothetical protein
MKSTAPFKSTYDELEAFRLRVEMLRPGFGEWDACDPVSHAILDVVEAQREVDDLIFNDANYGHVTHAAYAAAIEKRLAAGKELLRALRDSEPIL